MGGQVFGAVLAGNNFGDVEDDGIVGPLGLLIIVLLAIATVLLIRNMNSRLRRLPASFDPPERHEEVGARRAGDESIDSATAPDPADPDPGPARSPRR
jgi:hypothetical protein